MEGLQRDVFVWSFKTYSLFNFQGHRCPTILISWTVQRGYIFVFKPIWNEICLFIRGLINFNEESNYRSRSYLFESFFKRADRSHVQDWNNKRIVYRLTFWQYHTLDVWAKYGLNLISRHKAHVIYTLLVTLLVYIKRHFWQVLIIASSSIPRNSLNTWIYLSL